MIRDKVIELLQNISKEQYLNCEHGNPMDVELCSFYADIILELHNEELDEKMENYARELSEFG